MAVRRVLVVEDDRGVREALVALLELEGYAVEAVTDGSAALPIIDAGPPDLVVSDVSMPGMDGFALLARVRADHPTLPVLLLSAAFRGPLGDGVDFIPKPFDVDHLLAAVERLLVARPPSP